MKRDEQGRPYLDSPLRTWCTALRTSNAQALAHIDPARLLFVQAAARSTARASIRPLTLGGHPPRFRHDGWEKPQIWIHGTLALYEISLRPRYFLEASPDERASILAHELWHIEPTFDGSLDESRRHRPGHALDDAQVQAWVDAWRSHGAEAQAVLTFEGEARLPAWTERPPSRLGPTGRRRYSQDDLHYAIVQQR